MSAQPSDVVQPNSGPVVYPNRSESCCSSLGAQFITAFVVAIISGAGAALATYFLANHVILWTAVAGGGAATLMGIITFVAMRCYFGGSEPEETVVVQTDPKPKDTHPQNVNPSKPIGTAPETNPPQAGDPIQTPKPDPTPPQKPTPQTTTPTPSVVKPTIDPVPETTIPLEQAVPKGLIIEKKVPDGFFKQAIPEGWQYFIAVNRESLSQLITGNFTDFSNHWTKYKAVYYDPTNGLPVTIACLYQQALAHPTCVGAPRNCIMTYFADALLDIYLAEGNLEAVYPFLYNLDGDTVREIGEKVTLKDVTKGAELQVALKRWAVEPATQVLSQSQKDIHNRAAQNFRNGQFYMGVSADKRDSLFHALAQQLTAETKNLVTVKMLREHCADSLGDIYEADVLQEMRRTSYDLKYDGKPAAKIANYDESCCPASIADKYGVTIDIDEVVITKEVRPAVWVTEPGTTNQIIETPERITYTRELKEAQTFTATGDEPTPILRIANINGRFFPIWRT